MTSAEVLQCKLCISLHALLLHWICSFYVKRSCSRSLVHNVLFERSEFLVVLLFIVFPSSLFQIDVFCFFDTNDVS